MGQNPEKDLRSSSSSSLLTEMGPCLVLFQTPRGVVPNTQAQSPAERAGMSPFSLSAHLTRLTGIISRGLWECLRGACVLIAVSQVLLINVDYSSVILSHSQAREKNFHIFTF
jgi:hypothetical protein